MEMEGWIPVQNPLRMLWPSLQPKSLINYISMHSIALASPKCFLMRLLQYVHACMRKYHVICACMYEEVLCDMCMHV